MRDVIVVGAGIAGSSAALFLRQAGLSVLVLEREALPHAKTCAGGVPYSVLRRFPFDPAEVVEQDISSTIMAHGRREVTLPVPRRVIATVCRERLDARVLEAAQVEVRDRCPVADVFESDEVVMVRSEAGEEWQAGWLLAADGYASVASRRLGVRPKRRMVPAIEARIPAVPIPGLYQGRSEFAFGPLYGYTWVFPKRDHLSVGAGAFRRGQVNLKSALDGALARRGLSLGDARVLAHPLPLYAGPSALHARRTLFLGDAAGLVDPLQGEGIRHAVHSARIAADVVVQGRPPAAYTARVQEEIGRSLERARRLSWYLYTWQGLAWRLILSNPGGVAEMGKVFDGQQDYVAFSRRLPGIAWRSVWRPLGRTLQEERE